MRSDGTAHLTWVDDVLQYREGINAAVAVVDNAGSDVRTYCI